LFTPNQEGRRTLTKMRNWALTGIVSVGILTLGCGKAPVNDQAITTDIQSKLYSDPATRSAGIAVTVQNGAVTLSGDVPSSDVESQAMKIANGTTGVKGVTDQMKVSAAAVPGELPKAGTDAATPKGTATSSSNPPGSATPEAKPGPSADSQLDHSSKTAARKGALAASTEPAYRTIPAGERLSVRMTDPVDSGRDQPGQVYRASLDAPLVAGKRVVVPAGTPVSVVLESVKGAGRIRGNSEVQLRVAGLEYQGKRYDISSSVYEEQGKARGKQTAIRTGIGAAAGAIIGGLAGGGKGAAIGSAAGGGAGIGYNALTHGQQIKIPSEAVLNFRLEAPLRIEERH
jgi:BON domain